MLVVKVSKDLIELCFHFSDIWSAFIIIFFFILFICFFFSLIFFILTDISIHNLLLLTKLIHFILVRIAIRLHQDCLEIAISSVIATILEDLVCSLVSQHNVAACICIRHYFREITLNVFHDFLLLLPLTFLLLKQLFNDLRAKQLAFRVCL